jgi:transglutaminase/protease-like cytokinesis protein 3
MKHKTIITFISAFILLFTSAKAQTTNSRFKTVDEYVKSLGSLDTLNMGTISYIITKKFPDNMEKVRAIFDWIAYNISFDCKAARNSGNEKQNSDDVLKTRKTNASGYAALFQDMCSVVKIRCLTVDGYAKNNVEQINEKPDEFNHTWDVVQLGLSPETWFYVDPTWGSGYTDDKVTVFTKAFNDAYFFADKIIFNYQHFPDNMAWQLGGGGPKSIKDFFELPLVKDNAYEYGIGNFTPLNGFIKASTKKPVQFSFKAGSNNKIEIVALLIGTDKKKRTKTADYSLKNGIVSFSYKFDEEDSYPVTILINNKPVLGYLAEITD